MAEKIEQLTAALIGDDPFSSSTFFVEIEAPDVPDLTIIDLPGLVRTTTAVQKTSIIEQVDALVQRYLEMEQTIVLAVVPATVDIATSDILERALQVRCLCLHSSYSSLGVLCEGMGRAMSRRDAMCVVFLTTHRVRSFPKPLCFFVSRTIRTQTSTTCCFTALFFLQSLRRWTPTASAQSEC